MRCWRREEKGVMGQRNFWLYLKNQSWVHIIPASFHHKFMQNIHAPLAHLNKLVSHFSFAKIMNIFSHWLLQCDPSAIDLHSLCQNCLLMLWQWMVSGGGRWRWTLASTSLSDRVSLRRCGFFEFLVTRHGQTSCRYPPRSCIARSMMS